MAQIIGLVGFKQSGKSTAAKYLEEKYGFVRHNMKDALIAFMAKTLPDVLAWCREHYQMTNEELFENKPPLVRALMVNIGTDLIREEIDEHFWIEQWKYRSEELFANGSDRLVVDDIRFLNEANTLVVAKCPTCFIRIIRTDITTGGDHKSETQNLQIEADYTIEVGPGEQDKLYAELDKIMSHETAR